MRSNYKNAFSLSELLIILIVIGCIVTLTLLNLDFFRKKIYATREARAYAILEYTVSRLAKDDSFYPDNRVFKNTNAVKVLQNGATVTYEGDTKFCKAFASKIEKKTNENCENTNLANNIPSFVGDDNIEWYLPKGSFSNGWEEIVIDTDGQAGPNCFGTDFEIDEDENKIETCKIPDRFRYYILANGTISKEEPDSAATGYCCNFSSLGDIPENTSIISMVLSDDNTATPITKEVSSSSPKVAICGLSNGDYTLTVTPPTNYITNIPNDGLAVKVSDKDIEYKIKFFKSNYKSVKIKIDCPADKIEDCVSIKLGSEAVTVPSDSNIVNIDNLPPGNYKLTVETKDGYAFMPTRTNTTIEQEIHMGQEDIEFGFNIDTIISAKISE